MVDGKGFILEIVPSFILSISLSLFLSFIRRDIKGSLETKNTNGSFSKAVLVGNQDCEEDERVVRVNNLTLARDPSSLLFIFIKSLFLVIDWITSSRDR